MQHAFKLGDDEHPLALSRALKGYRLHLDGQTIEADLGIGPDGQAWLTLAGHRLEVVVATRGDDVFVHLDGETHQLRYRHPLDRLAAAAGGSAEDHILAPMPGSIVAIPVQAGDAVTQGQTLLVMESMKMETTIVAPRDGVIAAVAYEQGQTFDRDALLLSLEPATLTPSPSPGGRGERRSPSPSPGGRGEQKHPSHSGRKSGDEGCSGDAA